MAQTGAVTIDMAVSHPAARLRPSIIDLFERGTGDKNRDSEVAGSNPLYEESINS